VEYLFLDFLLFSNVQECRTGTTDYAPYEYDFFFFPPPRYYVSDRRRIITVSEFPEHVGFLFLVIQMRRNLGNERLIIERFLLLPETRISPFFALRLKGSIGGRGRF